MEGIQRKIDTFIEECQKQIEQKEKAITEFRLQCTDALALKDYVLEKNPQEFWCLQYDMHLTSVHLGCFSDVTLAAKYYQPGYRLVKFPVDCFSIKQLLRIDKEPKSV